MEAPGWRSDPVRHVEPAAEVEAHRGAARLFVGARSAGGSATPVVCGSSDRRRVPRGGKKYRVGPFIGDAPHAADGAREHRGGVAADDGDVPAVALARGHRSSTSSARAHRPPPLRPRRRRHRRPERKCDSRIDRSAHRRRVHRSAHCGADARVGARARTTSRTPAQTARHRRRRSALPLRPPTAVPRTDDLRVQPRSRAEIPRVAGASTHCTAPCPNHAVASHQHLEWQARASSHCTRHAPPCCCFSFCALICVAGAYRVLPLPPAEARRAVL